MSNKQDFTQGSIFGKIMKFMLPILGAQMLQAMYGAVDMVIVGKFGSDAGISAVLKPSYNAHKIVGMRQLGAFW